MKLSIERSIDTRVYLFLTLLISVIFCYAHFFTNFNYLNLFEDDYYYYAEIAQHISSTGFSTFDGQTVTNGYHPLWMACLVLIAKIVPVTAKSFFVSVYSLGALLSIGSGYYAGKLYDQLSGEKHYKSTVVFLYFSLSFYLSVRGMEVALTLLFMPVFLSKALLFTAQKNNRNCILLSISTTLLILSRLDTALFVFPVGCLILYQAYQDKTYHLKTCIQHALLFLIAVSPIIIYFIVNQILFDSYMPLSGVAKALKSSFIPAIRPWKGFIELDTIMSIVIPLGVTLTILLTVIISLVERRSLKFAAYIYIALLFPFVYILIISMRSDWQLWVWYYYPFVFAQVAVAVVLFKNAFFNMSFIKKVFPVCIYIFSLSLPLAWTYKNIKNGDSAVVKAAMQIHEFSKTHPGVYAMGDRAGIVAFLLKDPMIQLEGLVQDKQFIQQIKQQRSLNSVLNQYDVKYLIATNPRHNNNNWLVTEPLRAGSESPKMRGEFDTPITTFKQDRWVTAIFKLQQ